MVSRFCEITRDSHPVYLLAYRGDHQKGNRRRAGGREFGFSETADPGELLGSVQARPTHSYSRMYCRPMDCGSIKYNS